MEEEWERTARGAAGREYAWGNKFDRTRLNCTEFWAEEDDLDWNKWLQERGNELASTTFIGQFPEGCTPEGIFDLGGNVWEWTSNIWWQDKQGIRAIRGGSWIGDRWYARCAYRSRFTPVSFDLTIGFRVFSSG
jgi:formylglycine-generating enzyme required for sulfatase activity